MLRFPLRAITFAGQLFVGLSVASSASAQCLRWEDDYRMPAADGTIKCLLVHDDGSGTALYAGGTVHVAGGIEVNGIGRWDGQRWTSLGSGVDLSYGSPAQVNSLLVFDDGHGPALYVGGGFDRAGGLVADGIARWNGSTWSDVGIDLNAGVVALVAFDDGSGLSLYAAGYFIASGLPPGTNNIVRWDGQQWHAVGSGPPFGPVNDLIVHDDGSGPALYNTRTYYTSGTTTNNTISRWNGTSWIPIASNFGQNASIGSLCSFDDGNGARLYAAGGFHVVDGVSTPGGVARWNGTTWEDASGGLGTTSPSGPFSVVDDGSGPKLYLVSGGFPGQVKVWNGTGWVSALPGLSPVRLAAFDDGSGTAIHAGGGFQPSATATLSGMARWNGAAWAPLGDPAASRGVNKSLQSLATFDDGSGTKLYAAGEFTLAGNTYVPNGMARFDGSTWSAIPGLFSDAVLAVLDLGSGPALTAGSQAVYTWNGAGWSLLPGSYCYPYTPSALALCDLGTGPSLFVGGNIPAAGGTQLNGIGRYTGSGWATLGTGTGGPVNTLAAFDDGGGMRLFAGGAFNSPGGAPTQNLAKWNGTHWESVGGGTNQPVLALRVFDDVSGPVLFVGGGFTVAGGVTAAGVARWNGSSFSPAGSGLDGVVRSFAVFDDGAGAALYACGDFVGSAGSLVPRIAKWTGSSWIALGSGTDGTILTMAGFDDGTGPALFAGGTFGTAGADSSVNLAAWRACTSDIESICFGDGSLRPCPCSNEGLAGHGCQNSASTGGARIVATGATSPDTLVLHVTGELPSALSIFLQGNQLISAGVRFGDGVRCAGGSLLRLFAKSASGGAVNAPQPGDPSISARSAQLGDAITPGSVRYYQTYYRDPNLAYCPAPQGDTWNATNGVRVVW